MPLNSSPTRQPVTLRVVRPQAAAEPAEPIVKWAGGKGRLLPELAARLPRDWARGRYFEPFMGGGALFLHLRPPAASLSDINEELIHLYQVVRDRVEELIVDLGRHRYERNHYYQVRATDPRTLDPIARASRTLFLNRTCFNGLYRVNRKGQFNVPFGRYSNPTICASERLRALSAALSQAELRCQDFEATVADAAAGDVVYFDPPYVPLSKTSNFTSYTRGSFDESEQRRLATLFTRLAERGVRCMLSNSDTPLVRELYAAHRVDVVQAPRAIARDPERRGMVSELIVRSW